MLQFLNRTKTPIAKKVALTLFFTLGALVVLHLTLQYINIVTFNEKNGRIFELSNRFDLDDESSIPTWFSQALFLAIAASALLTAKLQKMRTRRNFWLTISAAGLLASIDEVAAIHEQILQTIHLLLFQEAAPTRYANAWLIVLPVIIAAAGWLLFRALQVIPKPTLKILALGMALFITGAVGIDIINTTSAPAISFQRQGVLVAIEESLEFAGTITILYAIIRNLESTHKASIRKALNQL